MDPIAARIAAAHADTGALAADGGEWAVVAGVPCEHLPLPQPWATSARLLVLDGPAQARVVAEVAAWLAARAPQWTLLVRAEQAAHLPGFTTWTQLPALHLARPLAPAPVPAGVHIGPAGDPDEFLAAYGRAMEPLVTPAHLASPRLHHLVARLDGQVVGCAKVTRVGNTARVSGVSVLAPYRRRGIGAALSAEASRVGLGLTDLVWLHCTDESRPIYERLGYRHVDDHLLLTPAGPGG
jgi:GNAT superfamily N-acetyltransferase